MRLVIASLIATAGLASAAQAQDPAAPASGQAPAAAQPAPAPQAAPAPAPAAPPAAEAAPAAPPAPPALPTTGPVAEVLGVLENICKPAVRGTGKLDDIAKAQGFKLNKRDGTWVRPLGGQKPYTVTLFPSGSNKTSCFVELHYAVGTEADYTKALNVWAFTNELDPTANYTQPQDPDGLKRVRRSWEHLTSSASTGLNFSTVSKPDGTPINPKWETATVQYQERKF